MYNEGSLIVSDSDEAKEKVLIRVKENERQKNGPIKASVPI